MGSQRQDGIQVSLIAPATCRTHGDFVHPVGGDVKQFVVCLIALFAINSCQKKMTAQSYLNMMCNAQGLSQLVFPFRELHVKEHPPPTFGLISCIESKFTQTSAYPGESFMWSFEKHSLKCYASFV